MYCEVLQVSQFVFAVQHPFFRLCSPVLCQRHATDRNNPFHNYEHASHVFMSVVKLLSRIVAPTDDCYDNDGNANAASVMHDHTYGITSDPLTQFACVLSALIHDVDHPGVPNAQLVKEKTQLAVFYENHSVAEQNSIDLAWNLLMDDSFKNLRTAIYGTEAEKIRFRQLVVKYVSTVEEQISQRTMISNSFDAPPSYASAARSWQLTLWTRNSRPSAIPGGHVPSLRIQQAMLARLSTGRRQL